MWHVEQGPEWQESWRTVAESLSRADVALGAVLFAVSRDPLRFSQGVTEARDSLRVLITRDGLDGQEVWVYLHVLQMPPTVTLRWAQLAPAPKV